MENAKPSANADANRRKKVGYRETPVLRKWRKTPVFGGFLRKTESNAAKGLVGSAKTGIDAGRGGSRVA